jgi:hypothetical protein
LRKGLVVAVKAIAAWDVVKEHDPVAGTVIAHLFTNRSHHAGRFVSEYARC